MKTLVFFLEESSAQEFLTGFLPRILPEGVTSRFIPFEGKQDLDKQLERRIRGWNTPDSLFVVLRDQDQGDCKKIKASLQERCRNAGKPHALIRIACRELENWYLGDLKAVAEVYSITSLAQMQQKTKFREPDLLHNAAQELRNLTQKKYQKVAGSRLLGPVISIERNKSHSFQVFCRGVLELVQPQESH